MPSFTTDLATAELCENFSKILFKILLPASETSLRGFKVFYDCSGGNSRPSRLSGVGGGNFLGLNLRRFLLARDLLLLDCV
jgi:hypothetical protein